jgi:protein TonB
LADLVYRPSLGEGSRIARGASPWAAAPAALAVAALFAGLAVLLGRTPGHRQEVAPSVALVLQEGPAVPVHAPPGGSPAPPPPRPAPNAQPPPPAPMAAPPPLVQPSQPPPPPLVLDTVPAVAPEALPTEDHSRDYGGNGPAVSGTGTGTGGVGTGTGTGSGAGAGGGGTPRVVDTEFSRMRVKLQPAKPDYPPLAKAANVQGTVVVEVVVGVDGVPISVRAVEGPYLLRPTAEAHARAWRFYPQAENGVPQVSRFTLSVSFKLTSPS